MRAMLILASLLLIAAAPADDRAGFDWQQHPGATLPLNVQVRNETGATQALAPVFMAFRSSWTSVTSIAHPFADWCGQTCLMLLGKPA